MWHVLRSDVSSRRCPSASCSRRADPRNPHRPRQRSAIVRVTVDGKEVVTRAPGESMTAVYLPSRKIAIAAPSRTTRVRSTTAGPTTLPRCHRRSSVAGVARKVLFVVNNPVSTEALLADAFAEHGFDVETFNVVPPRASTSLPSN